MTIQMQMSNTKATTKWTILALFSEDDIEEDIANLVVAWLKYRDLHNGTTHNCEYDFLGEEMFFEEFKGDEKVGTLAEIEIEIPSKQVIFKL